MSSGSPTRSIGATSALVEGGVYTGHEGVRKWLEGLFSVFPDFGSDVLDVRILEERGPGAMTFLVSSRAHGHGAGSDAPMDTTIWQVAKTRDHKVVWWRTCRSEADALDAVARELD